MVFNLLSTICHSLIILPFSRNEWLEKVVKPVIHFTLGILMGPKAADESLKYLMYNRVLCLKLGTKILRWREHKLEKKMSFKSCDVSISKSNTRFL